MQVLSKSLITFWQNLAKTPTKQSSKPTQATPKNTPAQKSTPPTQANTTKGKDFVMQKNTTKPQSDYNVDISLDGWIKQVAGINPSKQIKADLEFLYKKHPETFSKPSEVYKLIQEVKNNPQYFYTNNQPNIALMGRILENGKLGKIGIQKDYASKFLQVRHATTTSAKKANKENARLLKKSDYPLVERSNSTQQTSTKSALPTTDGEKTRLKDNQSNFSTKSPQTQGEILQEKTPFTRE